MHTVSLKLVHFSVDAVCSCVSLQLKYSFDFVLNETEKVTWELNL